VNVRLKARRIAANMAKLLEIVTRANLASRRYLLDLHLAEFQ
jgi:hypothetical protein